MYATTREQSREDILDREPEPGRLGALRRQPLLVASLAAVVFLIAAGGVIWWFHARHFEWTDDAFVETRTVSISPQVNGAVVDVPVTDNQLVQRRTVPVDRRARLPGSRQKRKLIRRKRM